MIRLNLRHIQLGVYERINWDKVKRRIEDYIDWNKVVKLLIRMISEDKLYKIKDSKNEMLIEEFKSLMEFLLHRLKYYQIKKIKHLYYWRRENIFSRIIFFWDSLSVTMRIMLSSVIPFVLAGVYGGELAFLPILLILIVILFVHQYYEYLHWIYDRYLKKIFS